MGVIGDNEFGISANGAVYEFVIIGICLNEMEKLRISRGYKGYADERRRAFRWHRPYEDGGARNLVMTLSQKDINQLRRL